MHLCGPDLAIEVKDKAQTDSAQVRDPDILLDDYDPEILTYDDTPRTTGEIIHFPNNLLPLDGPSALDHPLALTRFDDVKARTTRTGSLSLRKLADGIRKRHASEKKALPLLKLGTFGHAKTPNGSLRHDANLLAVSGIEGDYDAGSVTPDEAVDRLKAADIAGLIYTTPSHTTDAPRWRVLVPLLHPVTPAARDDLCGRLNGALGGILAGESFARSQTYYYGDVGGEPIVHLVEGRFIDAATDVQPVGAVA